MWQLPWGTWLPPQYVEPCFTNLGCDSYSIIYTYIYTYVIIIIHQLRSYNTITIYQPNTRHYKYKTSLTYKLIYATIRRLWGVLEVFAQNPACRSITLCTPAGESLFQWLFSVSNCWLPYNLSQGGKFMVYVLRCFEATRFPDTRPWSMRSVPTCFNGGAERIRNNSPNGREMMVNGSKIKT